MTAQLYPYQQEDLDFFSGWGRSANFSEPGVGKTPVAVRLINSLDGLPCLIICPNVVRYHWEDEIKKFWPAQPPSIIQYQGDADERKNLPDADVLICNYALFRIDFEDFFYKKRFKMTVVDEAHHLKNRQAQVTKCAYKLNTEYLHLMTGTPITKQFDDMWSYLRLLFPDQFSSYWRFVHRFGIVQHNGFGKEIIGVRPDRLHQLTNIIKQFSVRRTKKEVLPHLPDKTYQTIHVDLTPSQRKVYDELKELMYATLEEDFVEVPNVIAQLMRLRQIALTPQLAGFENADSAKLSALKELIADRKLAGKQTVIMTEFRQWADILENALEKQNVSVVRITGAENHEQQHRSQQIFQTGKADVALCTIKAAGLGVDLTAADMVIFTDLAWNDTDNTQAEDRIHRASQMKNVQVVKLLAKDTIDHVILDRALMKALTAQKVLGDENREKIKSLLTA